MEDVQNEVLLAIAAIRKATGSDLLIDRSAIAEIESQMKWIAAVTGNLDVEREGRSLVARALGRFHDLEPRSDIAWEVGLQGAVRRFEHVLRERGFLRDERQ